MTDGHPLHPPEVTSRLKFLRGETQAKVVAPPVQKKPRAATTAKTKG